MPISKRALIAALIFVFLFTSAIPKPPPPILCIDAFPEPMCAPPLAQHTFAPPLGFHLPPYPRAR